MRSVLVAVLVVLGCKDKPAPAPEVHGHSGSAAPALPVDWTACDAAIAKAPSAPLAARPQILIDGCHVCGDWAPILRWNTPTPKGGPKRFEIEAAMNACNAYCNSDAKTKFLGTLDDARGASSRMPWKQLAILCKDEVSAAPDGRFVNGAYFALDRIARAVGSRGGPSAAALAQIALPLPALSIVGTGPPLPVVSEGVSGISSDLQITMLGGTTTLGTMPRARLTSSGIQVDLGADGYPGKRVAVTELAAALHALAGGDTSKTVTIIAPAGMSAEGLVAIVAAAAPVMPVYLAARALESPEDYDVPAAIPVVLETPTGANVVHLAPEETVQTLAEQLAKRSTLGVQRLGIAAREL